MSENDYVPEGPEDYSGYIAEADYDDEFDGILEQQGLEDLTQDGYFENLEIDYDTDCWC